MSFAQRKFLTVERKRNEQNFPHAGVLLAHETLDEFVPVSGTGSSSAGLVGAVLAAGKGPEPSWPQSCVPLFTCSLWKLAGHSDAATTVMKSKCGVKLKGRRHVGVSEKGRAGAAPLGSPLQRCRREGQLES